MNINKFPIKKDFFYENFNSIINSFLPWVSSNREEKLSVLIQLVGGQKIGNRIDPINSLFIGSPGIGKTKIIESLHNINSINTEIFNARQYEIEELINKEYGALFDKRIDFILIDEIDKRAGEKTKEVLLFKEAVITKAIKTDTENLKVNNSILAVANLGNYDFGEFISFDEVLKLLKKNFPEDLVFSFDIIIYNPDRPDEKKDSILAEELIENRIKGIQENSFSNEEIIEYIKYVRENYNPHITAKSFQYLIDKLKDVESELTIDRRNSFYNLDYFNKQKIAIANTAIGLAKLNFRNEVEPRDIGNAMIYFNTIIKNFITISDIQNLSEKSNKGKSNINRDIDTTFDIIWYIETERGIIEFGIQDIKGHRLYYKVKGNIVYIIDEMIKKGIIEKLRDGKFRRKGR